VAIENPGPEYYDELHAYLDAGFARQPELLPEWTAANGSLLAARAEASQAVTDDIETSNAAYLASHSGAAAHENISCGKGGFFRAHDVLVGHRRGVLHVNVH
jgi:hypothetical protein